MSETKEGGCLCGNIRYQVTGEPVFQSLCYCTDCQTISGAAGYAAYGVPIDSLTVTRGEPVRYSVTADSGRINTRLFCGVCGSRVFAQLDELGFASVNGFTLDDRNHFKPTSINCPESAPDWCQLDAALETFPPVPR